MFESIQPLSISTFEEIMKYCSDTVTCNPLLIYGTVDLKTFFDERNAKYMCVDSDLNTETLRTLDVRESPGAFRLMLATTMHGMRGVDYRSKAIRMDLLVTTSFENEREAMQGLCRVGRFGDDCKRFKLESVPLIDKRR